MAGTDFVTEAQIDSLTTTVATSVKANTTAIEMVDTAVTNHLSDATDAHDASAISFVDSANDYTATNVEDALAEVRVIADTAAGGGVAINDSITTTTDAWSSSKISDEIVAAVAALIDGAPGALDTLNELAQAINDDAAFTATVTTALSLRLRFDAPQSLTGPQKAQALENLGIAASAQDFASDYNTAIA